MPSSSPVRTVLISGGGIAGPTLAYWLNRYGFVATLVETAPAPRPGGQAVDLRGAGRTVVERMDLMPEARRRSLDQRGIAYVDARGRHRAEMTVADFAGEGIVSELEILRGDLGAVLYDATAPDVEYHFGRQITALTQGVDGVEVAFDDGTSHRFDLVVGADGPHSGVRRLALGPETEFAHPLGGYTAWFTAPASGETETAGWYLMYNEPGGLVASVRPDRRPGQLKAGLAFRSDPVTYDRSDLDAQRDLLAQRFRGVGWRAPELVDAARTADDFYFDALIRIHVDRWSRGRVVLVGDAGYCPSPLTGLGTSLALVGAYVLAGELARSRGGHERAFRAYEQIMRPYVREGQQLPPGGIGGFAPISQLAIAARTLSTRLMVRWPFRPLVQRLVFSHAEAIDLPDYSGGTPAHRPT